MAIAVQVELRVETGSRLQLNIGILGPRLYRGKMPKALARSWPATAAELRRAARREAARARQFERMLDQRHNQELRARGIAARAAARAGTPPRGAEEEG